MNTLIAENHITITPKLFKEAMKMLEDTSYKKSIRRLSIFLIGLYLCIAVWLILSGTSLIFLLGETIFLASLLYWLFIMLPNTKYKNKYKTLSAGADTPVKKAIYFYEDYLESSTNLGALTRIPYSEIINHQETRNLYIITCTHNRVILIDKNGFTMNHWIQDKSQI